MTDVTISQSMSMKSSNIDSTVMHMKLGQSPPQGFDTPKKGVELTVQQKTQSVNVKIETSEEFKEYSEDSNPKQVDSGFCFKPAQITKKQVPKSKFAEAGPSDEESDD